MRINSVAPIRVCDNGGWTDTWFARYGSIFNIAVHPCAEVQLLVKPLAGPRITIHAENYGERYSIDPPRGVYTKHPLLEAAFDYMHLPDDVAVEVSIHCEAPAGCSTGTSAAVSVALIGALDCLTPGRMGAAEVAAAAQEIETKLLGQQCGIQDQIASAYGGINYIEMDAYPHATVQAVAVAEETAWELESRLLLIYLGDSHRSSEVHEAVIAGLSPDDRRLEPLRRTAGAPRDALGGGFGGVGAGYDGEYGGTGEFARGIDQRGAPAGDRHGAGGGGDGVEGERGGGRWGIGDAVGGGGPVGDAGAFADDCER
ncbi:MAG: hypothetical protein NTV52_25020 [Acidobacteria bacterium]|nr:hypothetical protein [Acidobacteriota bacterium]